MYSSSAEFEADEAGKAAGRRVGTEDARVGKCVGTRMRWVELTIDGRESTAEKRKRTGGSEHQQPELQQGEQGI